MRHVEGAVPTLGTVPRDAIPILGRHHASPILLHHYAGRRFAANKQVIGRTGATVRTFAPAGD